IERKTALAGGRVRELISDGVAQGRFREVHPALVADTVTTLMFRIGRGDTGRATGLDDATAYRELAALLLHGIPLERPPRWGCCPPPGTTRTSGSLPRTSRRRSAPAT